MRQLTLRSLEVQRILDIEGLRLDFDPRMTVLTGRNSQGKTLLCGAAILALLGLKELGSTHWKDKITSKNLARLGWKKGSASLQVFLNKEPFTFTYHHRAQSPHHAEGPDGRVEGKETLLQFGVDLGAIGFLTTRERQPAWRIVDGDTTTVLRNSLNARLSARVTGCEGVRKVVENEINSLRQQVKGLSADIGAILNRWVEKAALDQQELCDSMSAQIVPARLARLTSLKSVLEGIEDVEIRLQSLTELGQSLDAVKDLADLAESRTSQEALVEKLRDRKTALERLDKESLEVRFSFPPRAGTDLENQIDACNSRSQTLRERLIELTDLRAKPASLAELSNQKSSYEDQKRKLERAKSLQSKRGQGVAVSCTVYRGENLLVELDKGFASQVSFDELNNAEVVVPYSQAEEEQVRRIGTALAQTETTAKELQASLEATRGGILTQIADLRVSVTERQTKLKGLLPKLQEIHCPAQKMPSETGERLTIVMQWIEAETALANEQKQSKINEISSLVALDGMRIWKERMGRNGGDSSPDASEPRIIDALKEAIQSLMEHKDRFANLLQDRETLRRLQQRYEKALEVLGLYLDKVRFKDEILEQLIQTFLDFVRRGKECFDFPFEIGEESDGQLTIRSQYHEGATIQTGGGETQVLGILEMLAIAQEFGLPVFIDEIGTYLHRENLRKTLEFLVEHTEVQAVLTTADDEFLQHLEEWGIPHRGYVVTKDSRGFTQLQAHQSRASMRG